ncbi:hypothetical protein ASPFODRAFT_140880, partial [Aspergillus luchuensis CBS 106.47]
ELHMEYIVKSNPSHDYYVVSNISKSLQLPQAAIRHHSMGSLTPNPATVP